MTDTRHPGLITPGNTPRLADLNDDSTPYPSQITVFCDECGVEVTADYLVPADSTSADRLKIARDHLRKHGWSCNENGDYCLDCAKLVEPTDRVLDDIRDERLRQIAKLGEQHRKDGSDLFTYGPIAARSRQNFLDAEANGGATWHQVLNGPFYESISETDPAALRRALIELAAVACAWAEDIDSRKAGA